MDMSHSFEDPAPPPYPDFDMSLYDQLEGLPAAELAIEKLRHFLFYCILIDYDFETVAFPRSDWCHFMRLAAIERQYLHRNDMIQALINTAIRLRNGSTTTTLVCTGLRLLWVPSIAWLARRYGSLHLRCELTVNIIRIWTDTCFGILAAWQQSYATTGIA